MNTLTQHFPINSYVLVPYEKQKSTKLHAVKHGPYRVLNYVGTVYTTEHLVMKVICDFHILLSEYKHDQNNMNVDRVVKFDDEYAVVVKQNGKILLQDGYFVNSEIK